MIKKIIGSKVNLDLHNSFFAVEFFDCISDLLEIEDVKKMEHFEQHCHTTRLQHSLNVAYHSYLLCKIFHFDYRSAARAGLLHDLFLYDWRVEKPIEYLDEKDSHMHAFAHPKVALKNAKKNTDLNEIEEDAIVKHMWPLCKAFPSYKESYIVSVADKYCAIGEVAKAFMLSVKKFYPRYRTRTTNS